MSQKYENQNPTFWLENGANCAKNAEIRQNDTELTEYEIPVSLGNFQKSGNGDFTEENLFELGVILKIIDKVGNWWKRWHINAKTNVFFIQKLPLFVIKNVTQLYWYRSR